MLYVSLYVEGLRARPALVVWLAVLVQAALWTLVPTLFYAAPPGDLAEVLAAGREFALGSYLGPPLAPWLAEIAFRAAGLFGVYALAQICVIATFWSVFLLGSDMIGRPHAAIAVLLMVGVSVFTVPTPDFGPPILAMALWAAILLHYWRAVARGVRASWYVAASMAAMLLLTSDVGLILLALLWLFTVLTAQGRAALERVDPWIAAAIVVLVMFPHLLWLEGGSDLLLPTLERLRSATAASRNSLIWLRMLAGLILAHAGLAILVALAGGWPHSGAAQVPAILGKPAEPFAMTFLKVFGLAPALLATIFAVVVGRAAPIGDAAPLLVLSALAVVALARGRIDLHHQRLLGFAWAGLLLLPAAIAVAAIAVVPWTIRSELNVAQPADAMGRFFADNFQRRTGQPLAIVAGHAHTAALVALAAPGRPSVYYPTAPERSPWIGAGEIARKGVVVVWPTTDTAGVPPPDIKARFPDLVPEVPHTFERPVQGLLPLLRIGWAMIRPRGAPDAAPAPVQ
jgi:hypothetical protein